MKFLLLLFFFLLSSVSLAATNCDKHEPVAPPISDQDLSKRQERQLNRDMLRFLRGSVRFIRCIRSEYWAEATNDAPEPLLQELVAANNTFVKQIDELVAIYENRIGPIDSITEKLAPRSRARQVVSPQDPFGLSSQPEPVFDNWGNGPSPNAWTLGNPFSND